MAHILGKYAAAREGSYFKVEQEADLRRHAEKLRAERAAAAPPPRALPPPSSPLADAGAEASDPASVRSLAAYETLPEILQQAARIEDRSSLAHRRWLRTFDRKVAAKHPEPPEWAIREARRLASPLEFARPPAIPAGTFGRSRWGFEERRAPRAGADGWPEQGPDGAAWGGRRARAAAAVSAAGAAAGDGAVVLAEPRELEPAACDPRSFSASRGAALPPALRRGPSPAQVEASRRVLAAATRSMAYGTLLCLFVAASGAVAGAHALNAAGGVEAVRSRIRERTGGFGEGFRAFFQPWVDDVRRRVGEPASRADAAIAIGGAARGAAPEGEGGGGAPAVAAGEAGLLGDAPARAASAASVEAPRGSVALLRQRLAQRYNPGRVAELAGITDER